MAVSNTSNIRQSIDNKEHTLRKIFVLDLEIQVTSR